MFCKGFRNSVVISILIALLVKGATVEPLMKKSLFVKGQGGYNNYRIPALLTTQAGTLLNFINPMSIPQLFSNYLL